LGSFSNNISRQLHHKKHPAYKSPSPERSTTTSDLPKCPLKWLNTNYHPTIVTTGAPRVQGLDSSPGAAGSPE